MATTVLERRPVEIPDPWLIQEATLDPLTNEYEFRRISSERSILPKAKTLAVDLVALGIQPFTLESVQAYKKEMLSYFLGLKKTLALSATLVFISALVLVTFGLILLTNQNTVAWAVVPCCILLLFLGILKGYSTSLLLQKKLGKGHNGDLLRWDVVPLYEYWGHIPEKVQETIDTLKREIPKVKLHVEFLADDPFLFAEDSAGNRYYLEVWDESYTE